MFHILVWRDWAHQCPSWRWD